MANKLARTSILSKYWYNAWLTRPDLDFKQGLRICNRRRFIDIVKKTLQRYEESDLKIVSFRLLMTSCEPRSISLTTKLVQKAIRIGVTNRDLIFSAYGNYRIKYEFILPYEVLESETLTNLSLHGCTISSVADRQVRCLRLKSLSLRSVCLVGDIIWDIISGCPLIEKLVICECSCLYKFETSGEVRMLTLGHSVNPYEFQRLKFLQLEKVNIDALVFRNLSSKFPCLKDLIVQYCYGFDEIVVSSHSLECFKLSSGMLRGATFDVPSICDFYFVGACSSSLTFETYSKELKCDISISYDKYRTSWFTGLKKLLRNLSLSRIYLRINTWCDFLENSCDDACDDDQGLPTPVVEDFVLTVKMASLVPSAFLYSLFRSCHPKFLTLDLICFWTRKAHCGLVKFLCKTLILEVSELFLCKCGKFRKGEVAALTLEDIVRCFNHSGRCTKAALPIEMGKQDS